MNKPTDKQKQIIGAIRKELAFWAHSNDITSPTLNSDIGEMLRVNDIDGLAKTQIEEGLIKYYKQLDT